MKQKDDKLNFHDQYKNEIKIYQRSDGSFHQETQTNKSVDFNFLNKSYSYGILNSSQEVKSYWETDHSERKLLKDKYGNLFHYCYEEEAAYGGGDDRVDILWVQVKDEKDSDTLSEKRYTSLFRDPYVVSDETNWVAAHETIDSVKFDIIRSEIENNKLSNNSLKLKLSFFNKVFKWLK
jgi:hypothetical protein